MVNMIMGLARTQSTAIDQTRTMDAWIFQSKKKGQNRQGVFGCQTKYRQFYILGLVKKGENKVAKELICVNISREKI
jgi:hypothetical protein